MLNFGLAFDGEIDLNDFKWLKDMLDTLTFTFLPHYILRRMKMQGWKILNILF